GKAVEAARSLRDLWLLSEVEYLQLSAMLNAGQPREAGRLIHDAAARAERIGNFHADWICKHGLARLAMAQGDLAAAERAGGVSFEISRSLQTAIDFLDYFSRGTVAFFRSGPAESVAWFRQALDHEPPICFRGVSISNLFAALAAAGDPAAADIM